MTAGDVRGPDRPRGPRSERFGRDERLRLRVDYLRCYRQGKRRQGAHALLYFLGNGLGCPRLGITASRKVGAAVERHRLKRCIREIYRRSEERWQVPAMDLVVHLKPEAKGVDFADLREDLLRLFRGVRLPAAAEKRNPPKQGSA
jgi:ribonuclease P protein component